MGPPSPHRPPHTNLVHFPEPDTASFTLDRNAAHGHPATHPISLGLLHAAIDALPHWIWMCDSRGAQGYGNTAWQECTGRAPGAEGWGSWLQWLHAEDQPSADMLWQQSLRSGAVFQGEYRLRHHSGSYRWWLLEARFQKGGWNAAGHWFLTGTDIHDRVLAQQEMARNMGMQRDMLDVSVDCIKLLRTDGTLIHMNQSGCHALGVDPDSGFGQRWLPLLPEEVRGKGRKALELAVQGHNARFAGMSIIDGHTPMHWDNILTPVKGPDGTVHSILCVSRDITLQREAERRLRQASEQDELTGLPNRRAFNKRLQRALAAHRMGHGEVGMLLLDLDHFKHVNDTLGHPAGDHLLRILSRRLQQCMPEHGFVARLGGDEFAILLTHMADATALEALAHSVLAQIEAPITYASTLINGGMSMGGALYPRDAQDPASLVKCADTALNDLKAGGRGGMRMFNAHMLQVAELAAAQLHRARQIVRDDAIVPYYQPKVQLANRTVVGFEALLRWRDAAATIHAPSTVMAAFKDYELATRIGDTMRAKVFADITRWQQAGLPVVPVSLNAAPVEFLRDDYAERLLEHLHTHALSAQWVELEITEHIMGDRGSEYVIRALKLLKQAGVKIALDDFGTGHSSLAHLRDYPVDCLKIDCEFVQRIGHDPTMLAIVKAMGQLGPNLSLETVAEGMETEEQRHILMGAGYQVGQGYLFGQAGSADEVERILAATRAPA